MKLLIILLLIWFVSFSAYADKNALNESDLNKSYLDQSTLGKSITDSLASKPSIIWMRPVSFGVAVNGHQIVHGAEYDLMRFLAASLTGYSHQFESYPVKRSWEFIKSKSDEFRVFCFFGATKTLERSTWGIFSEPTTILLPFPIVAKKGSLDHLVRGEYLSLAHLFEVGKNTVIFDGVVNQWTQLLRDTVVPTHRFLTMTQGKDGASKVTARLIKGGRIDFGFVGSGDKEIKNLQVELDMELSVYQLQENAGQYKPGNRLMCSKTELGQKAIKDLNNTIMTLLTNQNSSAEFRDLNFEVIGYHPNLKASFDKYWLDFGSR